MKVDILKKNIFFVIIFILLIAMMFFLNDTFINIEKTKASLLDESDVKGLVINELITSNNGVFIDNNGDALEFIELYNGTNKDINLLNYGLSDRDDGKVKWLFPDVVINKDSYLIVYLSGEKKEGLYANFRLSSIKEETVTLKKPNGKVVDAVKTKIMDGNSSLSRSNNNTWIVTSEITPGYPNTVSGREKFLYSSKERSVITNDLIISEVLPSNEGNVIFDGNLYSYIEITNNTDSDINIHNYYLSNDENLLYKYRLPNYVLKANSAYLVFTNKLNNDNNASFSLKKKTGKVFLTSKNGIVDEVSYTNLANGVGIIKINGEFIESANITPGGLNNSEGKILYQSIYDKNREDLIINEVMPFNNSYLVQNGNQYYDYIELYNNTSSDINLKEYYLTTNKDDKEMFKLPDYILKANSYYVLMASGDVNLSNSSYVHTNFRISNEEGLFLYKEKKLIDSLFMYDIPRGYSYGRGEIEGHFYYQNPTPNYKNENSILREVSNKPKFDIDGGFYNNIEDLSISLSGMGDIYYTLDGSNPTLSSSKYEGPFHIQKSAVIKAMSYEGDKVVSDSVTNSYIVNMNHKIPIVSVTVNKNDFNYITNNPWSKNYVNAHMEYFDNDNRFEIDCGMKIFGGESRTYKKKSYTFKFNSDYQGSLHYKMFDNKEIVEFNDLVLRSGSQEQTGTMFKDEFLSTIAVNYTSIDAQAAKPCVLYINGEYYGIYFIREKINDNFIKRNHNINTNSNIINAFYNTVEEGSINPFRELKNYSNSHDLSLDSSYEYISSILDIDNFIDYYIFQFTTCNYDLINVRMYNNSSISNGKIRMILYDEDYALRTDSGAGFLDYLQDPYLLNPKPDTSTLTGLLKNEKFRKRFVERMSYFVKNVWTEEHILEVYNYYYDSIKDEMVNESSRWNISYDNWVNKSAFLKNLALSKAKKMPLYTKSYFKLTSEEYNEYFG